MFPNGCLIHSQVPCFGTTAFHRVQGNVDAAEPPSAMMPQRHRDAAEPPSKMMPQRHLSPFTSILFVSVAMQAKHPSHHAQQVEGHSTLRNTICLACSRYCNSVTMQANIQATMHCRWKDTHPTKPNLLYLLHDTVVVHIGVQSSFVSPARPKGKAYGTVHTRMTAEELQMLSLLFSPLLQFCYDAGKYPNQTCTADGRTMRETFPYTLEHLAPRLLSNA